MKKRDWFFIIINGWLALDIMVSILSGNANMWDYIECALFILLLIIVVGDLIFKEIEICKKVKEMRQNQENSEHMDAQKNNPPKDN